MTPTGKVPAGRRRNDVKKTKTVSYDEAKRLARDPDPALRKAVAARTDIFPEILFFLADDPEADVRRTVATNPTAPRRADLILARDAEPTVRSEVARKLAGVLPGESDDRGRLGRMAYEAMALLASDHVTRVRQALSEALKSVADAPPDVIRRLARDVEIVVSGPILEYSPVLTDADLIQIIGEGPAARGALDAIARRANLNAPVSDAVVGTNDVSAVATLLTNPSAQIREETLDYIINNATAIEGWHAPLVRRPELSPDAVMKISRFVADNLLDILTERQNLDPETRRAIQEEVHKRLAAVPDRNTESILQRRLGESVLAMAKRLDRNRTLDAGLVLDALGLGDTDFVTAALSVLADYPFEAAERLVAARRADAIVALAWKADMPVAAIAPLQKRLGRVPGDRALAATPAGEFPLSRLAMETCLDGFRDASS